MEVLGIALNILLGALPECLFYTFFITYVKGIKRKRIALFTGIFISYCIFVYGISYTIAAYVCFTLSMYVLLRVLYGKKAQIIDIFLVFLGVIYLMGTSYFSYAIFSNHEEYYMFAYIVNRLLLFALFLFRKQIRKAYLLYVSLWNRGDSENRVIKSLTLRILSLCIINVSIFIMYIFIIKIIG